MGALPRRELNIAGGRNLNDLADVRSPIGIQVQGVR